MSLSLLPALLISFLAPVDEPAIFSPDLGNCATVCFTPDGDWLATGGLDGRVRLWSANSCLGIRELGTHDGEVNALAISRDGKLLASGDLYKRIEVWSLDALAEIDGPKRLRTMKTSGAVDALAFDSEGKRLLAGIRDNAVLVFDLAADESSEPRQLGHDFEVGALAVAADGSRFASGDGGGAVRIWSLPGCEETSRWKYDGRISALLFAKDGTTLFVATAEPKLRAVNLATGKERVEFGALSVEVNALALDGEGKSFFAGTQDNRLLRIDATTGKVERTIEGHEGPLTSVALAPDGQRIVSAGRDRSVRITNLR